MRARGLHVCRSHSEQPRYQMQLRVAVVMRNLRCDQDPAVFLGGTIAMLYIDQVKEDRTGSFFQGGPIPAHQEVQSTVCRSIINRECVFVCN